MIGVVIPALNEEMLLPGLLADLRRVTVPLDIVVADGGSVDGTLACASAAGVRSIRAPRGRARQLNAGAQAAHGDWLLFLHADVRLPAPARRALLSAVVDDPDLEAAVFRFSIELRPGWKRFIEIGQVLRQALYGLPYGDQGLLVRRELFDCVGGFPDLEIMEDVEMIRRVKKRGVKLRTLPAPVITSGRRYEREGPVRTWLRHVVLISLYLAGVSPHRLAGWRSGDASYPARR